jgi:hypothetical protein
MSDATISFERKMLDELKMPEDLDEAADWLSDVLADPEKKKRISATQSSLLSFLENAALILSALAERENELRLSRLLAEVAINARKH